MRRCGLLVLLLGLVLAAPAHAAFPGKNGKLGFLSADGGLRDVFSINLNGTGKTNLTNNGANNTRLSWSPDGETVAFQSDGDTRDSYYDIYRVNADGSGLVQLTHTGNASPFFDWSPDGSKIAFSDRDIYTINADGSGLTRLTDVANDSTPAWSPAWSPDGKKIAFVRSLGFPNYEIYTMNADGSGQARLTYANYQDESPSWSPDGSKIGFTTNRETGCQSVSDSCYAIYAMNADGSGQARLTANSASNLAPVWSPDGSKIAFLSFRDANYELYAMNADGSRELRLTHNAHQDFVPVWSPDSRYLASARDDGAIYIVNRDGSGESFLTGGQEPDWQPIPGPKRSDYKNAAQFCKAEHEFLGEDAFRQKYGGGASAYGKCVSGK